MKVKIELNGSDREVLIKGLKRKQQKEFFKQIRKVQSIDANDPESVSAMEEFMDFWDSLVLEFSDLSKEEYEGLDLEEQNKLINAVKESLVPFGIDGDFLKSSSK